MAATACVTYQFWRDSISSITTSCFLMKKTPEQCVAFQFAANLMFNILSRKQKLPIGTQFL
jgi:hypothetical protein